MDTRTTIYYLQNLHIKYNKHINRLKIKGWEMVYNEKTVSKRKLV